MTLLDKNGWQTSEFWKSLIPQVFAALLLMHVVSGTDATTMSDALVKIVEAVFSLAGSAAVVWKYIDSRTRVKEAQATAEVAKHESEAKQANALADALAVDPELLKHTSE